MPGRSFGSDCFDLFVSGKLFGPALIFHSKIAVHVRGTMVPGSAGALPLLFGTAYVISLVRRVSHISAPISPWNVP